MYGSKNELIWSNDIWRQRLKTTRAIFEISDLHTSGNLKKSVREKERQILPEGGYARAILSIQIATLGWLVEIIVGYQMFKKGLSELDGLMADCEWCPGTTVSLKATKLPGRNKVNHGCLLQKFHEFGFGSSLLQWFSSHLMGHY